MAYTRWKVELQLSATYAVVERFLLLTAGITLEQLLSVKQRTVSLSADLPSWPKSGYVSQVAAAVSSCLNNISIILRIHVLARRWRSLLSGSFHLIYFLSCAGNLVHVSFSEYKVQKPTQLNKFKTKTFPEKSVGIYKLVSLFVVRGCKSSCMSK